MKPPERRFRCSLQGHSHWVRSAVFSPDERLAVSGGEDKAVMVSREGFSGA